MFLTRISVGNPVFATMMMIALVVIGLFSYRGLAVDEFPEIDFPIVIVQTAYPGASPETVETDVTRKIEDAVNTVNGINISFTPFLLNFCHIARHFSCWSLSPSSPSPSWLTHAHMS